MFFFHPKITEKRREFPVKQKKRKLTTMILHFSHGPLLAIGLRLWGLSPTCRSSGSGDHWQSGMRCEVCTAGCSNSLFFSFLFFCRKKKENCLSCLFCAVLDLTVALEFARSGCVVLVLVLGQRKADSGLGPESKTGKSVSLLAFADVPPQVQRKAAAGDAQRLPSFSRPLVELDGFF